MILLKELKVCPYKRCGHQVYSTFVKKEISDVAEAMISAFSSTPGRCLSIFCKQLRHILCYASLCFPYFCPVAATVYGVYFISCTRRLDWKGHLITLEKITPWLLAYNRVNYSRCVPVYLHKMREFEKTHPFAHEQLRAGEFAIQQQDRYGLFATAADQVIEQTVNRDNKSAGGIVGITTRPNAVCKSILSQSQRLAMTQLCRKYADEDAVGRCRKDP